MIINTLYKIDTIIDGIKYNPPSKINNDGYTIELIWKNENNKYHNENGPAVIVYDLNGNIEYKSWWINDKWHNENGPARIGYDGQGSAKGKGHTYVNFENIVSVL